MEWDATESQEVPADTGLYIDTMVQFTPTEDGSEPVIDGRAKLAIWLNVATAEDGTATTNLCVRGEKFEDIESSEQHHETFTLVTGTGDKPDIRPGVWYRLTVKALKCVLVDQSVLMGFQIKLDGVDLKPSVNPYTEASLAFWRDNVPDTVFSLINAGEWVPCLSASVTLTEEEATLFSVGFKGSGAIDDFLVTTTAPTYETTITFVDFTLTWDDGVSSVTYTIEGETEAQTATEEVEIRVAQGKKVTVAATPADWYTITDGTGEFTVTENTTKTITAVLDSLAGLSITGFDSSVSTSDVKGWADAKKISLNDLKNNEFAYNSYLLNTGLLTADPVLTIDDVTVADGKMTITVAAKTSATDGGDSVDLENIKGVLYVKTGDTLDDMKSTTVQFGVQTGDNTTGDSKLTVTLDAGKFAQVKIGAKPPAAE